MKILLTKPLTPWYQVTMPLGLGYLAGYLKAETSFDVRVIDAHAQRLPLKKHIRAIEEFNPDYVGVSATTLDYPYVKQLAIALRRIGRKVIIGGPHATALPEEVEYETGAVVIAGEAEYQLRDYLFGEPTWQDVPDINKLPFPYWDDTPPRSYPHASHGVFTEWPVAPVMTTRGCPYKCSFCAAPFLYGGKIRFRNPQSVVDEIVWLKERYGVKEIHFEDDNLTLNRRHVSTICELLIGQNVHIRWCCPNGVRIDTLDESLLRLMKAAGCYRLAFGIESYKSATLDLVHKDFDIQNDVIESCRKIGIETAGFLIFGLPGETIADMKWSLRYARESNLDWININVLTILPGSELHRNYTDYAGQFEYTDARLHRLQFWSTLRFYAQWRRLKLIGRSMKLSMIPSILRRAWVYVAGWRHFQQRG